MQPALKNSSARPVAIWLLVGTAMIMIQVLLGGITRLTGSGLSITEWKPLLGTIPPLNEKDWHFAFEQYKQIGQFKHLNFDFTLEDFKFIYFWEWLHRNWARLMAIVFIIPFLVFIIQKRFKREMIRPMIILFLLGALQGIIGWIMVKSGLNEEDLYVSHIRLAIHFIAALVLLCYAFWFALQTGITAAERILYPGLKHLTSWIVGILVIQLVYGALMAGLKAASFAPTWPTINGNWWPEGMGNIFDNPISVQFIHRGLAYLITILIIAWWWKASKFKTMMRYPSTSVIPVVLVLLQVVLGILTVIYSPERRMLLWFGMSHQLVAMLLLLTLVYFLFVLRSR